MLASYYDCNAYFQTIAVLVKLTANHLGHFEFKVCANDNFNTNPTQACLDQNLLADASGNTQ